MPADKITWKCVSELKLDDFLHENNLILFTLNLPAGSGMRIPPTIFQTWQVFVQVNIHFVQGGLHANFSHVYIIVLYRLIPRVPATDAT